MCDIVMMMKVKVEERPTPGNGDQEEAQQEGMDLLHTFLRRQAACRRHQVDPGILPVYFSRPFSSFWIANIDTKLFCLLLTLFAYCAVGSMKLATRPCKLSLTTEVFSLSLLDTYMKIVHAYFSPI